MQEGGAGRIAGPPVLACGSGRFARAEPTDSDSC